MNEKRQRQKRLRVAMESGSGVHERMVDTEEFHEKDQEGAVRFLQARIAEIERQLEVGEPRVAPTDSSTASGGKTKGNHDSSLKGRRTTKTSKGTFRLPSLGAIWRA
ncbi:hypothetical protein N9L19_00765 [bacterium]|nr:hypothetical protein [bacterium]